MTPEILTGTTASHTITVDEGVVLHKECANAFLRLKARAKKDKIHLKVASSFRDFSKQMNIWNEKCKGQRKVLDKDGEPLAIDKLNDTDLVFAILRWSALPGASRHHWGTDLDVFDGNALPANYALKLTPQEVLPEGPFYEFNQWLDLNLKPENFFRPYQIDKGGVSPEWWHISFAPLSEIFLESLTIDVVANVLKKQPIEKKQTVLKNLPLIFEKFVRNI